MKLTTVFFLERRWNFMVSLKHVKYDGNNRPTYTDVCAGSIVSLNLVITLAKCVVSLAYQPGFEITKNNETGLYDGLLVLSNSVYSEIGKSATGETHHIKQIILAPETEGKHLGLK